MNRLSLILCCATLMSINGCHLMKGTYAYDMHVLKHHTDVIELRSADGKSRIAVVPQYQGRVMTSSAAGAAGQSFGWINHELIASGEIQKHINVFGGEDRFWLGPEGGQFAIFFKKGDSFEFKDWQTPPLIDTESFDLIKRSTSSATFRKNASLTNYAGTQFKLQIDRGIQLLDTAATEKILKIKIPDSVKQVACESDNTIKNTGDKAWQKETGLLSIWVLGMFNPSPATTVVIPYKFGPQASMGQIVNDMYFGKVPADRLKVDTHVMYFSGDGKYRSKIGVGPQRALPICGSYDAANQHLTIVQFNKPDGALDYVNSMWEHQKQPYGGDVVNSYNDGPATPGAKPLGPFYELETSSKAAALKPDESLQHIHRTFHFQGSEADLDPIARKLLGVSIEEIKSGLK